MDTLHDMSRQILYSRLFFSATMFFGCAPDRDTPVQSLLSSTPAIPHGQAGGEAEEDLPAAASAEDLEQTGNIPVLYALHRHVWIRTRPSTQAPWIGFLGLGSRVVLREPEPVRGVGCDAFYAIEPRGYVCADRRVSLDPTDPAVVAVQHIAPSRDRPWLHDYAESRQAPRYEKLPTVEQKAAGVSVRLALCDGHSPSYGGSCRGNTVFVARRGCIAVRPGHPFFCRLPAQGPRACADGEGGLRHELFPRFRCRRTSVGGDGRRCFRASGPPGPLPPIHVSRAQFGGK